jgi:hypothetical protein
MAIYSLYQQIRSSGHIPAEALRVRRLYNENASSPNNVAQLEIELQH